MQNHTDAIYTKSMTLFILTVMPVANVLCAQAATTAYVNIRRRRRRTKVSTSLDKIMHGAPSTSKLQDEDTTFWGRQLVSSAAPDEGDGSINPIFIIGTYQDQFGTLVTIDKDSITISYECVEGYEDYPPTRYIILPEYSKPQVNAEDEAYVIAYDDENGNGQADPGEYSRFDYILGTPDGRLEYYCEIDYGEETLESAIADGRKADTGNLESGCNSYPWSKLHLYEGKC